MLKVFIFSVTVLLLYGYVGGRTSLLFIHLVLALTVFFISTFYHLVCYSYILFHDHFHKTGDGIQGAVIRAENLNLGTNIFTLTHALTLFG